MVKGLTAADFAALDSITEKRRAALEAVGEGGTTSRNAVVVAALRAFIRRELPDGDRRF